MFHVQRILYPTDFSSYSNNAYFHAVALAETHQASLTILYVYNPAAEQHAGRERTSDRRYWLGQLEQIRPANPDIPIDHVMLEGDPSEVIARYAADAGFDMVVMGTHGRTGKDRQLLGSVAEQTLRSAPCSVLVVKLPRGMTATIRPDLELVGAR